MVEFIVSFFRNSVEVVWGESVKFFFIELGVVIYLFDDKFNECLI